MVAPPTHGGTADGCADIAGTKRGETADGYTLHLPTKPRHDGGHRLASQAALLGNWQDQQAATEATNRQRGDALYEQLLGRAQQSLDIDPNDPIIRRQTDAFGANAERASRTHVGNIAERSGPLANILGEERLAAERLGQTTGAFEAELIGRELTARRQEIADAIKGLSGRITADQQQQLQRELATIDASLQQQGLGLQERGLEQNDRQFAQQMGLDYERMNQNERQEVRRLNQAEQQDVRRLSQQNQQFAQQLGLDYERLNVSEQQEVRRLNQQDRQFAQQMGMDYERLDQAERQEVRRLNQQAQQHSETMGFNYEQLSQQDQQFIDQLTQRQSQFGDRLGFDTEDRASYYDLIRSGLL